MDLEKLGAIMENKYLLVLSIILALLLGIAIYNTFFSNQYKGTIILNGMELSASSYNSINNFSKDYVGVRVCPLNNPKDSNCVTLWNIDTLNKIYQGPVPQNSDEEYFRQTGVTKQK